MQTTVHIRNSTAELTATDRYNDSYGEKAEMPETPAGTVTAESAEEN